MDKFIHRENLALFKRRFAEAKDESQRRLLAKLLAEEEAKDSARPKGDLALDPCQGVGTNK